MSTLKKQSKKKTTKKKISTTKSSPKSYLAHRWQDWLVIGLLTFMCYIPMLQNAFVGFDDKALLTENPLVVNGDFSRAFSWGLYTPYFKPAVFTTWIVESLSLIHI